MTFYPPKKAAELAGASSGGQGHNECDKFRGFVQTDKERMDRQTLLTHWTE